MLHKKMENCFLIEYTGYSERKLNYMHTQKYTYVIRFITQRAVTCSKSVRETPEQCVKFI